MYGIQSKFKKGTDFTMLNDKTIDPNGPKAMIGPGTGLGMGYLVKDSTSNYYQVRPSEGGHQDFAAKTQIEFKYMMYLKKHYNVEHVSIERACCGPAIVAMYRFLSEEENITGDSKIKEEIDVQSRTRITLLNLLE